MLEVPNIWDDGTMHNVIGGVVDPSKHAPLHMRYCAKFDHSR